MLDTVLEIGKVLRKSPDGLRHHRYIKKAPVADEDNPIEFWSVPVRENGNFNFGERVILQNEYRMSNLYYLNYKQSDADSTKKYIFGDICRTVTKTGSDGNFKFADPDKKSWMGQSSFERGEELSVLDTAKVKAFRKSFRQQHKEIVDFLSSGKSIYLHFDFSGRDWHQLDELQLLNESVLRSFFKLTERGYVLDAFLFKSLAAGSARTPDFSETHPHRIKVFNTADDALDLLYGVDYASKAIIRKNEIKIVVLPRGENLTAPVIERFFERVSKAEPTGADEAEDQLRRENEPDRSFAFLDANDEEERTIARFDFIFSKAGGTQPDVDMIELSGLERSKLSQISSRIISVRREQQELRERYAKDIYGKSSLKSNPITIMGALNNVLGDVTTAKKKYQRQLLSVLPKIYTGTYYDDPLLLPSFVRTMESNIRNDAQNYKNLKFDYTFLQSIQINGENRLMDITTSPSFQIGLILGQLAKPLSREINSFEKNYVGLLSRRIGTLPDVVKLANEFRQKLVMHEKLYPNVREASNSLSERLIECHTYNKDECAFGFFESYFSPIKQQEAAAVEEAVAAQP